MMWDETLAHRTSSYIITRATDSLKKSATAIEEISRSVKTSLAFLQYTLPTTTIIMFRNLFSLLLVASASAFAPVNTVSRPSSALNVAIDTSDIKNGMTIELEDGEPYKILSFSIMKQARGAAKTTIKFKNLIRGNTLENTYISGKKLQTAMIEKSGHQYTYEDGNAFFFMNSETFEEVPVDSKGKVLKYGRRISSFPSQLCRYRIANLIFHFSTQSLETL
jgi:translation elongation factor P/translation initiation factor 5A